MNAAIGADRTAARMFALVVLAAGVGVFPLPARAQSELRLFKTKYYLLHTDLDDNAVAEAVQRITLMAEEYNRRTKQFGGQVRRRLPFFLFKSAKDYYAQGGMPGSVGVFTGDRLMAVAGPKSGAATWHVVQHEGFHQFIDAAVGRDVPPWVNEGLAEYFGLAVFTGDGFVPGIIPQKRLEMVRVGIRQERFKSIRNMMQTDQEIWNAHVVSRDPQAGANYIQGWAMVHFLAHGDDGKYQKAFSRFIRDVGRGTRWEAAWRKNFGRGVAAFEDRWRDYWLNLPDDPTAELRARANVATLTSFLGRAFSQRQYFEDVEAFFAAAAAGELKAHEKDTLAKSLLENALSQARQAGKWSFRKIPGRTLLVRELDDGRVLEGSFRVRNRRIADVKVAIRKLRK